VGDELLRIRYVLSGAHQAKREPRLSGLYGPGRTRTSDLRIMSSGPGVKPSCTKWCSVPGDALRSGAISAVQEYGSGYSFSSGGRTMKGRRLEDSRCYWVGESISLQGGTSPLTWETLIAVPPFVAAG
jgi:hypothetical protein